MILYGRSYVCDLPNGPPMLASGLGARFIPETPVLRTNQANLSKSMQWLALTYTRRFNNRHFRSGHLFQGRFKSIIVQNDAYLMRLSYYIHRNPLRAGIIARLAEYPWSSYKVYAG